MVGVYKLFNAVENKYYIGSSSNIHKRIISHKSYLNKNKHYNYLLQRAYNQYGWQSFEVIVVKECNIEVLKAEEQKELDLGFKEDKVYNLFKEAYSVSGENHPMFGKTHSNEAKTKIRIARSKQTIFHSQETRDKISASNKGKIVTLEHIKKMIAGRNGDVWNKGIKTGISPANKINFTNRQKKEIIKLYEIGHSIEFIRKKLRLSWDTINYLLVENKIKIRNISEQKKLFYKMKQK